MTCVHIQNINAPNFSVGFPKKTNPSIFVQTIRMKLISESSGNFFPLFVDVPFPPMCLFVSRQPCSHFWMLLHFRRRALRFSVEVTTKKRKQCGRIWANYSDHSNRRLGVGNFPLNGSEKFLGIESAPKMPLNHSQGGPQLYSYKWSYGAPINGRK